jgi:acetyl esterase/lipase
VSDGTSCPNDFCFTNACVVFQIAGYDPLRDEGIALAERMKAEGGETEVYIYKGLPHCFSMLFPHLPQSKDFYERQDSFIKKMLQK